MRHLMNSVLSLRNLRRALVQIEVIAKTNFIPQCQMSLGSKYRVDVAATNIGILDVDEQLDTVSGQVKTRSIISTCDDKSKWLSLDALVQILKKESVENLFICKIPKHLKYADYMCIATCRSPRHMNAVASIVRTNYKLRCVTDGTPPKIEGKNNKDWIALDLGNIAMHIFTPFAREIYDIESLWSIGSKYDKKCRQIEYSDLQYFSGNLQIS